MESPALVRHASMAVDGSSAAPSAAGPEASRWHSSLAGPAPSRTRQDGAEDRLREGSRGIRMGVEKE
jgi:hypothetical protein